MVLLVELECDGVPRLRLNFIRAIGKRSRTSYDDLVICAPGACRRSGRGRGRGSSHGRCLEGGELAGTGVDSEDHARLAMTSLLAEDPDGFGVRHREHCGREWTGGICVCYWDESRIEPSGYLHARAGEGRLGGCMIFLAEAKYDCVSDGCSNKLW